MVKSCCDDNMGAAEGHHSAKSLRNEPNSGTAPNKNLGAYIMLALVGVLLIFALVQTVQINSIGDSISRGSVSVASAASGTGAQAPAQTAGASPAQAPTMVGGC